MLATFFATTLLVTLTPAPTLESGTALLTIEPLLSAVDDPDPAPADATLADWMCDFSEARNVRFLANQEVLMALANRPVVEFGKAMDRRLMPFQQAFESMLMVEGFLLVPNPGTESYVVQLADSRGVPQWTGLEVDPANKEMMASHPAVLMTTHLEFDYVDSRMLTNSMRSMANRSWQHALSTGPRTMTLTSTGAHLLELITAAQRADVPSADDQQRQAQPVAPAQPVASAKLVAPASNAVHAPTPAAKPTSERAFEPLATRMFMVESEHANDIVRIAEQLVSARFRAGLDRRDWVGADGQPANWPQVRFYTSDGGKRVLVQAAEADIAMVEADLKLAKQLMDGIPDSAQ